MKTSIFFVVCTAILSTTLHSCLAFPRRAMVNYDLRQDGKLNVHAKLDNFLIIIAPTMNSGGPEIAGFLQNDLVAQALQLKNSASNVDEKTEVSEVVSRAIEPAEIFIEQSSDKVGETSVKLIAKLQNELPDSSAQPKPDLEKEEIQVSDESKEKADEPDEKPNLGESSEKSISVKSARSLPEPSDASNLPSFHQKVHVRGEITEIRHEERGNSVGSSEREPQELKLIGGAIENCGPDRYRDSYGICRFRVQS